MGERKVTEKKSTRKFEWMRLVALHAGQAPLREADLRTAVLVSWFMNDSLTFFRSCADLSRDLRKSETSARKSLGRLVEAGFLRRVERGTWGGKRQGGGRHATTYAAVIPEGLGAEIEVSAPLGGAEIVSEVSARLGGAEIGGPAAQVSAPVSAPPGSADLSAPPGGAPIPLTIPLTGGAPQGARPSQSISVRSTASVIDDDAGASALDAPSVRVGPDDLLEDWAPASASYFCGGPDDLDGRPLTLSDLERLASEEAQAEAARVEARIDGVVVEIAGFYAGKWGEPRRDFLSDGWPIKGKPPEDFELARLHVRDLIDGLIEPDPDVGEQAAKDFVSWAFALIRAFGPEGKKAYHRHQQFIRAISDAKGVSAEATNSILSDFHQMLGDHARELKSSKVRSGKLELAVGAEDGKN